MQVKLIAKRNILNRNILESFLFYKMKKVSFNRFVLKYSTE